MTAKGLNGYLKYVGAVIALLTLFAAIIASYSRTTMQQAAIYDRLTELQRGGSDLARQNEKCIIEMKSDVRYIRATVDKISDKLDD